MTDLDLRSLNVEIDNHALSGDTLPTRLKILGWGKNKTNDGDVYLTDETCKVFSAMQAKIGRDEDVAIDFEHNTVPGSKEWVPGQARDVAGYGDPELIRGDGLYLSNIKWTPMGKEKASNYKDLSPACPITKDGLVIGLHSVALTTNGAVYGLKFYSAGIDNMIKLMAVKDYNKEDANSGVKQEGDKYVANPKPLSVEDDKDALVKTKELEDHEENKIEQHPDDCMCAQCMSPNHSGADDSWTGPEHDAHKSLVKDFAADDDHLSKYGDVKYADEANHRYPIDTDKHIRAAWSYVNMPKNAKKLGGKLSEVKSKIAGAMKKIGAEVQTESADEMETMSANNAQPYNNNNMENTKVKTMAAPTDDKGGKSDSERVLFALLAKFMGEHPEFMEQLTKKENTEQGGLSQWSAKVDTISHEIKTFKAELNEKQIDNERQALILQATKEGKVISLSANAIKKLGVDDLKEYVSKLETIVPMKSKLKILSANPEGKPSKEKAVAAFEKMLSK